MAARRLAALSVQAALPVMPLCGCLRHFRATHRFERTFRRRLRSAGRLRR
jgi:hypothetical protein